VTPWDVIISLIFQNEQRGRRIKGCSIIGERLNLPKQKAPIFRSGLFLLIGQRPTLPHTWRVQYHRG
jgi:hypothetical protein